MIEVNITLTNDECEALDETVRRVDATLAKRMSVADTGPRDRTSLAWAAFQKLTQPIRRHLLFLKERK